ncbi:hypothetical protein POY11_24850, partial [Klebsiella aerogenes]
MAVTDTQQAAQFSADAAVSAAEAKQYLIESQQGYQDTSKASQEALAAAAAAAVSEQNSSASEASSAQSAEDALSSKNDAEAAASSASEYAENKFTFYKTSADPDGTIAGLAATVNGQSFRVAQGVDGTDAFITYQNDNGVAVAQAAQPGTAAITGTVRTYSTLTLAQNDVAAGNILDGSRCWVINVSDTTLADEYTNADGTLMPTGRKMPSAVPTGYQAATAVGSSADNTIDLTIPGLLVDGALVYFLSPILNTGAVTVSISNSGGIPASRPVQKQANSPLTGGELLINQPVLMEYRTGTANNFVLVASGPVASELVNRISALELNSILVITGVTSAADSYSGVVSNIPGIVASDRVFLFTPNATSTT